MAIIVLEHSDNSRIKRLGTVLIEHGHRLRILRLEHGDTVPRDLDDVDGVVTLGGAHSVAGGAAPSWLDDEVRFLRAAHEAQLPVLGLCLGSQILAGALGGEVGTLQRPEIGWHDIRLSPAGREDPVFAGLGWTHMQFHWHRDHVAKLPRGARLLASSASCPVQAWAVGVRTYAMQFHPEIDLGSIEQWVRDDPDDLVAAGLAVDELRRRSEELYGSFERCTRRLFESIALFLMPIERRYTGLVKDLRH